MLLASARPARRDKHCSSKQAGHTTEGVARFAGGGMWQGRGSRAWRTRAVVFCAALLVGWATWSRAPASVRHTHHFPTVQPDELAHYLADFSNHALLYPRPESWTIESEWSNFTSWRYDVSYTCGARCAGRATVVALGEHGDVAPRHGAAAARRHRVLTSDARCTHPLPLFPWPALCEKTETETIIVEEAAGKGSILMENALARCSPLAALLAPCAGAAELVTQHRLRLRALTVALTAHG